MMSVDELRDFLDFKAAQYNTSAFIEDDPISIPYFFTNKEDIEIAAFFAATLAWGNRKAILKAANQLMSFMGHEPFRFVVEASNDELVRLQWFVYRTFNGGDMDFFVRALRRIYVEHGGLEGVFAQKWNVSTFESLANFRDVFFDEAEVGNHASKHVANVAKGSSAKRLNMFLRWMVRKDSMGVDFGLWHHLGPERLYLPLDLHTGNVSRKLGILQRKQNDWKAVAEVTNVLRQLDPADPVKYDYALFGLGIYEKF
jgi:uncharacterized protein (TIGR02757 family)